MSVRLGSNAAAMRLLAGRAQVGIVFGIETWCSGIEAGICRESHDAMSRQRLHSGLATSCIGSLTSTEN